MDFSAVKDYMDRLHSEKNVPGCDLMVYYEGNPVFYHAAGWADDEKTVPVSGDTLYLLYSCTKPITTVAALQLVERGKMTLDTPVMELIPAMADAYVVENEEKVVECNVTIFCRFCDNRCFQVCEVCSQFSNDVCKQFSSSINFFLGCAFQVSICVCKS